VKAIRLNETGGPEVLSYEEVPVPEPEAGQARVKIEAIGVNFIETYQRSGQYPVSLPFAIGQEAAGVVEMVGADVGNVRVEDRVAWAMQSGSYAEAAVIDANALVTVPEGVETRTAAAVLLQGMTAHYLSMSLYPIKAGDDVLIHAAAGGVGALLTQMAKKQGARVFGTVSNEEKAEIARAAGIDEVIFYTKTNFTQEVRRLTDGAGVNVVYESVGKETFEQSLDSLKPRGYLVLFGQSSGAVAPVNPQVLNQKGSLFLTRPTLGHYIASREELDWRAGDLFRWINDGSLQVRIDTTFALADAAEAHRYLEARQTKGKVLLIP
jgi:NADPH2:quinone reductase